MKDESIIEFLVSSLKSKSRMITDTDDLGFLSVRVPESVKQRLEALKVNSNLSVSVICSLIIQDGLYQVEKALIEEASEYENSDDLPSEQKQMEVSAAAISALKTLRR